ncbi:hypothetical protein [Dehalococcoides mccartyi]|uniref:hypothetical protein n=1 Tax=Dehalococcoides mccartyi TaxID=61435 RepID=UPI000870CF7F|nr:hypothetical protein [Dehalococcoides mccartyi]AOV98892.1 hypothetical protein DCWBC2_0219 [Dehalococcoides mccartyi]
MTKADFANISYTNSDRQTTWCGVSVIDGDIYQSFLSNAVASRLHDEEGVHEFETCLRGLATTGFARDSLNAILTAEVPEERAWAIGEAIAEAYLEMEYGITWPWNMERDKRTPNASLPGADLIGFEINNNLIRLALGEVKTSSDTNTPPNVMNGRGGMIHQIDNLASNLGLINQLLKWLLPRCKGTDNESLFNTAITLLLESGNKAVSLFGVLVRDTQPHELDLKTRGQFLANTLQAPATCQLVAMYLPCNIADLPSLFSAGGS